MTLTIKNIIAADVADFGSIATAAAVNPVNLSDAGKSIFEQDFAILSEKNCYVNQGIVKFPVYNQYQKIALKPGESVTIEVKDNSAEAIFYKGLACNVLSVEEVVAEATEDNGEDA